MPEKSSKELAFLISGGLDFGMDSGIL